MARRREVFPMGMIKSLSVITRKKRFVSCVIDLPSQFLQNPLEASARSPEPTELLGGGVKLLLEFREIFFLPFIIPSFLQIMESSVKTLPGLHSCSRSIPGNG